MKTTTDKTPQLPPNVIASDLRYPSFKKGGPKIVAHLDFYLVRDFGWCIATLLIRNPGRRHSSTDARTYAVRIDDGATVRVGLGPHVLARCQVIVTDRRLKALQRYVDLKAKGEADANSVRDRISTRRMRGDLSRARSFLDTFA